MSEPVLQNDHDLVLKFEIVRNGLPVGRREFKTIQEAIVGLQQLESFIKGDIEE